MSEDHSTPKKEKQERLSKHKENMQHSQAEEEAQLLAQQRVFYDRNCRAFKRKVIIKRHDLEQEQIREVSTTQLLLPFSLFFFVATVHLDTSSRSQQKFLFLFFLWKNYSHCSLASVCEVFFVPL